MPKLRILPSARNDLVHVLKSVGRESSSAVVGEHVARNLRRRCVELSQLPGTMGRSRLELAHDLRSIVEGNFVIFLRYTDTALEIVAIIDGRRDAAAVEAHLHSVLKQ